MIFGSVLVGGVVFLGESLSFSLTPIGSFQSREVFRGEREEIISATGTLTLTLPPPPSGGEFSPPGKLSGVMASCQGVLSDRNHHPEVVKGPVVQGL